ncbi:unnamed protein product [Cylindrotheca closterium]|uniref:Uracil-DNA glycosylase-like domain-containing protein n=1 Tax=Cylindrotheca closterium TaxID=2856 RepID=A0AAD2JN90_9STRA|nr:unnamed protein product [Cylindrotheca closterium]
MVVTRSFFAQFAHNPVNDQDANITSTPAGHSPRWNRVTPTSTPEKKRKSSGSSDESSTSTPKKKSSPKKKRAKSGPTPSTSSFDAVTAANFTKSNQVIPPVHTLLLGTHPSVQSLKENRYYGHPMNAFWWIAGDCLGFRRAEGLKTNGEPYGFASHLRYNESQIVPYEQQLEKLCFSGFALWDIVKECQRPGSLDSDITQEVPNDIRGFCKLHPNIKRIVFSNGGTACSFFKKHFKEWLDSGELVPSQHKASQDAFKKWTKNMKPKTKRPGGRDKHQIECIVALAVSPAAAKYTYDEKRDFWEEHVYQPGLKDLEAAHIVANDG